MRLASNQQGALLLEVLVTVVILSTGLTLIVESMATSLKTLAIGTQYDRASWLADKTMSSLLLHKTIDPDYNDSGDFAAPFDQFHYQVHAQPSTWTALSDNPVNEIDLTISWPSGTTTRDMPLTACLPSPPQEKK